MAEWVFLNGRVFGHPRAEAVAVGGGRIEAIGSGAGVLERVSSKARVFDLGGRLLVPGFQDAHIHPASAGLKQLRCDIADADGKDTALARIAEYAASHPSEPWVLGGGWSMDWFQGGIATASDLDRVVPDRPVYLTNRDGHGAWVNSKALTLASVSASTPDPPDGRVERKEDGAPIGTLQEGAMALIEAAFPPATADDFERGLLQAGRHLLSLGITGWQDAWVTAPIHEAYLRLARRGGLVQHVVAALWWDRHRDMGQLDELAELRESAVGRYRPTSVKLMLDGVCENFTAAMLAPYLDRNGHPTANSGIDFIEPDELARIVTRLDAAGFQCHFHAIGDRAVRHALNAVEAARRANPDRDLRHHVAHIQVIHPGDIPRFRRLGVIANAQAYWACEEGYQVDLTIPFLGEERSRRQYPFGDLVRAGARLAMGSDWSVSTPNPLQQIEVAVNRVAPYDRDHRPFLEDQKLGLGECFEAFTLGSAFVNHLEDVMGSIEVGKRADLAVIDRDPFDPDTGPIGEAVVDLTMIGGTVLYER